MMTIILSSDAVLKWKTKTSTIHNRTRLLYF